MPKGASDDNTKAGPGDEYREIFPKPDASLTAAFLEGKHCLVGVSVYL